MIAEEHNDVELIKDHTDRIDGCIKQLEQGTGEFKSLNKKIEGLGEKISSVDKKVDGVQQSLDKKEITNGHTEKEVEELKESYKTIDGKLDGIVEDVGYLKGKKEGEGFKFNKWTVIISLIISFISGILVVIFYML